MEFFNYAIDKCDIIINFLLKQSIYTSILFVIIFGISFFLKKKSPHWHFGLWMLILIRLLLPTDLSFSISARNIVDHIPLVNNVTTSIDGISTNLDTSRIQNIENASINMWIAKKIYSASDVTIIDKLFSWQILFTFMWIAGCLLLIVVILKKLLRFHRIIKKSVFIKDDKLTAFLLDWQHRLKIKRTVRIVSSNEFLSPFTVGIFRPIIYIPRTLFNSADIDTIHSIIAHELVHIKHYDALWIKFQNFLQVIYFFNPVVWYANKQISLAREQICDSTVITCRIISPKAYGNSILQVLKYNLFGLDLAELLPSFGSHKKIYKQRIQNITKENAMKKQKTAFIVIAICLIGFFVLPLAGKTDAVKDQKTTTNEKTTKNDEIKPIVPMKGNIISLFGWRENPLVKGEREFHTGIDIAAPNGAPIYATASGVVTKAGQEGDYGYLVVLQHKYGYSTLYGQCSKILVKKGQTIKKGDIIALSGQSGKAAEPHVHYEIRLNGEPVNPYPFLKQAKGKEQ